MDDGRTRILTERQDAACSHLGVAQELQGHVLIVLRCLGVGQDLGHLQVMLTAEHELHIVESLLCQQRQRLFRDLDNLLALKLCGRHTFLTQQTILRLVLAHLKHRGVLEFYCFSHKCIYLVNIQRFLLS